jgi:hypothetical protein
MRSIDLTNGSSFVATDLSSVEAAESEWNQFQ